jgi:hypothetical protein
MQVSGFFILKEDQQIKEGYILKHNCEQVVSDASENSEYLVISHSAIYTNDHSGNTLLSDNRNIRSTYLK